MHYMIGYNDKDKGQFITVYKTNNRRLALLLTRRLRKSSKQEAIVKREKEQ